MNELFNSAAKTYDVSFTDSYIGRQQRNIVWKYLRSNLDKRSLKILEINGGTGTDALFLASLGHQVLSTDASEDMMHVARSKLQSTPHKSMVTFMKIDIKNIHHIHDTFDLIFSDFGGLNCLSPEELKQFSPNAFHLLKDNGKFIAVVMPKFCAWESFYFLMKARFTQIFRRNTQKPILVSVNGTSVATWYYSPKNFKTIFDAHFSRLQQIPVGIAIPPSYLEPLIQKHSWLQGLLSFLEKKLNGIQLLAPFSDHFLIEFQKK